ncbi:MAG: hypothetical protein G01um101420_952 [Parcubacteria group bacterium Gr01-1014_20]|nr:MAG: hypothetical protein G01um101420_952 [Parcubacteria group bacterium Gr01-1014_20]
MFDERPFTPPKLKVDQYVSPPRGKAIKIFLAEGGDPYARVFFDQSLSRWMTLDGETDIVSGGSLRCFVFGLLRSEGKVLSPRVGQSLRITRFCRNERDVHGRLV